MVLQEALGWEDIRYEEAFSGGQFGIKLDITSRGPGRGRGPAFQAPVRYVPTLTESMWMTSKRHPLPCHLRLGADDQGRLTGLEVDFTLENGAYTSWGRAILLRILQMLSGGYQIPQVKALGELVYTNNAWGGAARGAGPPQINFALESAMDMLARQAGRRSPGIPAAEYASARPIDIHRAGGGGMALSRLPGGPAAPLPAGAGPTPPNRKPGRLGGESDWPAELSASARPAPETSPRWPSS